ncbi:tubulin-specific chaperone E isoform 2-T2 [Synchiropus picturatus]
MGEDKQNAPGVDAARAASDELPADAVGRRVSCSGHRATVRYMGPVPPTKGVWLGVEWDDPDRGKHGGSHEGVHYFTCSHPSSGSFVRPAKVSFGCDYVTAVRHVYQVDVEEVLSQDISISSKKLEWAGVLERSFENLKSLLLMQRDISGPGADGEVRKMTPNVRLLNLSRTLMSSWDQVAAITQQLEHLEELELSYNRLRLPSDPLAHMHSFSQLKTLALNSCGLSWSEVLECAPMWPKLQRLSLEENNISSLLRPEDVLQALTSLSLSGNLLQEDSLSCLAHLPRLEELHVSNTGLSVLRFPDVPPGGRTSMFPALKNLHLDHNNISEWFVVNELAKLPCLVKLQMKGNKLGDIGNLRWSDQVIAKLERLQVLNNGLISRDDRLGAELVYMRTFGEEWLKAGGRGQLSEEFRHAHPSYQHLIQKHGPVDEEQLRKNVPFALKNRLIDITFVFPDDPERTPVSKKLPAFMSVQKIKGLLRRWLKLKAPDVKLCYTRGQVEQREMEMADLKSLDFYLLEDGDQVLVRWA